MKILIADDASTMRHLLLSALSRTGYDVEVAASGDHAWSVLQRSEAPEIAILDWMMPGITGVEICQKLRERSERNNGPYVYVIMLTGLDAASDLAAGLDAGADDYMTKPFKPAELNARLRNAERILALQRDLSVAQTELRAAAQRDPLTSLANRQAMRTCLDDALAQAQRQQQSLGVMLLDIDDLKMLNDTRGEAEGDVVLQRVATRLTESIGPDDSVGRFAAGRFMIVVPACNLYESVMLAERIRKLLCDTPINAGCGPISISASFGVSAASPELDQVAKPLIKAAQRALHRAKAAGGNRVYLAASDSQAVVIGEKQTLVAESVQPRIAI
jgi:two-component system chemotaxis response regulator CheY